MKKIIFLRANPNAIGGAENYLKRLANALKNSDINSEIRSFKGNQKISSWKKALKFNNQVCREKKRDEFYFSLERVECADIYRAGDGVHKVYRKLKKIWWFNPLNFVYPYLEKKCFENSKKIITNSNLIKEQIISTYNIDKNKIITIYNGVNLPEIVNKSNKKIQICKEFSLDEKKPLFLFVGSGFKRKGVREFLEILSKFPNNYNAIIIGNDKNIKKYKKIALKLRINAIFLGSRKDVSRFYEASDFFIFPTHYEPFSNVILEALSYGCVCFTTKQNGASEILDDQFVMNHPTDFKILDTIKKFVDDKSIFEKQSKENIQKAKNFSIEKNASLTMKVIYENIY
ncbi:glycosyltransferase family 4 protein [Campylobacter ureolyticus]|uniref:glycosyltransferase family 4 protein n=1 Tax=Campylobacter ureolyticus TaxID=827 RepID=UPI0026EB17CB|nr:glycosyltransferase family 4 protein [Campylobacter ureolyticus]